MTRSLVFRRTAVTLLVAVAPALLGVQTSSCASAPTSAPDSVEQNTEEGEEYGPNNFDTQRLYDEFPKGNGLWRNLDVDDTRLDLDDAEDDADGARRAVLKTKVRMRGQLFANSEFLTDFDEATDEGLTVEQAESELNALAAKEDSATEQDVARAAALLKWIAYHPLDDVGGYEPEWASQVPAAFDEAGVSADDPLRQLLPSFEGGDERDEGELGMMSRGPDGLRLMGGQPADKLCKAKPDCCNKECADARDKVEQLCRKKFDAYINLDNAYVKAYDAYAFWNVECPPDVPFVMWGREIQNPNDNPRLDAANCRNRGGFPALPQANANGCAAKEFFKSVAKWNLGMQKFALKKHKCEVLKPAKFTLKVAKNNLIAQINGVSFLLAQLTKSCKCTPDKNHPNPLHLCHKSDNKLTLLKNFKDQLKAQKELVKLQIKAIEIEIALNEALGAAIAREKEELADEFNAWKKAQKGIAKGIKEALKKAKDKAKDAAKEKCKWKDNPNCQFVNPHDDNNLKCQARPALGPFPQFANPLPAPPEHPGCDAFPMPDELTDTSAFWDDEKKKAEKICDCKK